MVAGTTMRFKKNGNSTNNPSVNSKPIRILDKNAEKYRLRSSEGVVVTNVLAGSSAAYSGIRPGMVIYQVNRQNVNSVDEFHKAAAMNEGRMLLLIDSGRGPQYLILKE